MSHAIVQWTHALRIDQLISECGSSLIARRRRRLNRRRSPGDERQTVQYGSAESAQHGVDSVLRKLSVVTRFGIFVEISPITAKRARHK